MYKVCTSHYLLLGHPPSLTNWLYGHPILSYSVYNLFLII